VFTAACDANVSGRIERAGKVLIDQIAILLNTDPFETVKDFIVDVFIHRTYPVALLSFRNQSVLIAGGFGDLHGHGGLPGRPDLRVGVTELDDAGSRVFLLTVGEQGGRITGTCVIATCLGLLLFLICPVDILHLDCGLRVAVRDGIHVGHGSCVDDRGGGRALLNNHLPLIWELVGGLGGSRQLHPGAGRSHGPAVPPLVPLPGVST